MDISELLAFSLCSKRTKNLVKSLNRKTDHPFVFVYENCIRFNLTGLFNNVQEFISLAIFDSYIEFRENRTGVWKRQEFTQSDWIAHILDIFNKSIIQLLRIENASPPFLDTLKQVIPKCRMLVISETCSTKLTKIAFWKLFSIAEQVDIHKNIFDDANDISKSLTLNLKSVGFNDWQKPFKLKLNDLLALNIALLSIAPTSITEKELNRFIKLWMKGSHKFYRPKFIRLTLDDEFELNRQKVFKGIKYEFDEEDDEEEDGFQCRMRRGDGKELIVWVGGIVIGFHFS
ncbi:unnamed protein product [Caenorhabditis nigoni]